MNSSGMLHAAGFGISTFACPAGPVQRKYPDMKPAGRFDLYLICISRTRHRERRLVVLFGLPPPGSTQVLTQKPRHPAGRASRIYAAGAMCAAPDPGGHSDPHPTLLRRERGTRVVLAGLLLGSCGSGSYSPDMSIYNRLLPRTRTVAASQRLDPHQRNQASDEFTDPPTIATPNTYERRA